MSTVHWLALSTIPGVGGVAVRRLIERFGSVEAAFDASDADLLALPRFTPAMLDRLRAISIEALEDELRSLSEEGLDVLTWEDDGYPANLREAHDAPPLLFARGALLPADATAVAIVGTRDATPQGSALAAMLARELAGRGVTVVSGLALGIDSAGHRGALEAGGRTLAVLGSGLRVIHPRENTELAEEIVGQGALLSELHPNSPPRGPALMARDRIIAGLSRAVIVVEAGLKSGSLDTAERTARLGRPVFALPGSPGTEALLAGGAARLEAQRTDWDALLDRIGAPARDEPAQRQLSLWD
jgi:DNA processing protein